MSTTSAALFIYWIGMAAVAVFAIAGALESGRKRMDIVGVSVVALATALGGGTVRDLLLDRPVFWVLDQTYVLTAFAAALATFYVARKVRLPASLFLIPDAIGLALFAIAGTQVASEQGAPWLVAALMGVITATFGGVLRDVFCNEIPLLFLPGELYASAAFGGALGYLALRGAGVEGVLAAGLGMALVFALRLGGMYLKIRLPTFVDRD